MSGNMNRLSAAAVVALVVLVGGCSSDTGDSAKETVTVTASASTAASASSVAPESPTGSAAPTSESQSGGTVSPADFPDISGFSFATPSREVQCRKIDREFLCQTLNAYPSVAPGEYCGNPAFAEQGQAREFMYIVNRVQPCASVIQGDLVFNSPHTLQYGQSITFPLYMGLVVTCTSTRADLRCTDSRGSGFTLSATSFKRTG